jgi:hypothetical protein
MAFCNLVGNYQHSGETYCLHFQGGILFQHGIIIIIVVAVVLFIIIWNSYCLTICNLLWTWCLFILVHSFHCNIPALFFDCILHCINLQFKAYMISHLLQHMSSVVFPHSTKTLLTVLLYSSDCIYGCGHTPGRSHTILGLLWPSYEMRGLEFPQNTRCTSPTITTAHVTLK